MGTAKKATLPEPPATCSYEDAKAKMQQVQSELGAQPAPAAPAKPKTAAKPGTRK